MESGKCFKAQEIIPDVVKLLKDLLLSLCGAWDHQIRSKIVPKPCIIVKHMVDHIKTRLAGARHSQLLPNGLPSQATFTVPDDTFKDVHRRNDILQCLMTASSKIKAKCKQGHEAMLQLTQVGKETSTTEQYT